MNKLDLIRKFREDNGLTVQEVSDMMGIVLHPAELRDQFAMAAMQAMLTGNSWNVYELAQQAYATADTMLEVRIEDKEDGNVI